MPKGAFFGTPIGATGFLGRYGYGNVWDLMVEGKMLTYIEGQFEPTVYLGGDPAYLKRGSAKGVAYVGSTWMIDYGRGLSPCSHSGSSPRRCSTPSTTKARGNNWRIMEN